MIKPEEILSMSSSELDNLRPELFEIAAIARDAKQLFDNRLGWSDGRNPYAPRCFWYALGRSLYGKDSQQVKELLPLIFNHSTDEDAPITN